MPLKPEEVLQIAVLKLAKEVISGPFRLRAFDRSRDFSGRAHIFQKNKGLRTGTPDLELIYAGRSINVELKAPGTKHLASHQPTDQQKEEMRLLREAGAYAGAAWSCLEVVQHWRAAGVPLCAIADALAEGRDRTIECGKPPKTKRTTRPRAKRDDPAAIRRMMRPGGSADRDPNLLKNRTLV
jgi:hypothetical protein